jgi:hypothetical protein
LDDHHAEFARMLLDQIDALTVQIATLTTRIEELLAAMPDAQPTETGYRDSTQSCSVTVDTVSSWAVLEGRVNLCGHSLYGAEIVEEDCRANLDDVLTTFMAARRPASLGSLWKAIHQFTHAMADG